MSDVKEGGEEYLILGYLRNRKHKIASIRQKNKNDESYIIGANVLTRKCCGIKQLCLSIVIVRRFINKCYAFDTFDFMLSEFFMKIFR